MDIMIVFGLISLFFGGGIIYPMVFSKNKLDKMDIFIGALAIISGILSIMYPYRTYKDFYIKHTTPIDNVFYYIGAEIVDQSVAGITIFETEDENLYEIETNPNWSLDCVYLLTMDDNATPENKKDDKICVVWAESSFNY